MEGPEPRLFKSKPSYFAKLYKNRQKTLLLKLKPGGFKFRIYYRNLQQPQQP